MNELVINKVPFKDSDLLVTTLNPKGINSYVLKNGQKLNCPFKREFDYLNIINLKVIKRLKLYYIVDVNLKKRFTYVPGNYQKIAEASKIIAIINKLNNVIDNTEDFYTLVIKSLTAIENNEHILLVFLIKLSYFLGRGLNYYEEINNKLLKQEIKNIYEDKTFNYQINKELIPNIKIFLTTYYQDYFTLNL